MGKGFYSSPIGILEITSENGFLIGVRLVGEIGEETVDRIITETKKQLREYFDGERRQFDLPINFKAKGFCLNVFKSIAAIPYGETITYARLAELSGSSNAFRSAGSCAGKNPILIVVPCHRVVAKNGIGGFALDLDIKKYLLALEYKNK